MTEDTAKMGTAAYLEHVRLLSQYGDVYIRGISNNVWEKYPDGFSEIDNVTGFYHKDEPGVEYIEDTLPAVVTWHNTYARGKLFHVNLLPSYGFEDITETYYESWDLFKLNPKTRTVKTKEEQHQEYVQKYVDEILTKVTTPKTLGLDNYPLIADDEGVNYIRASYLTDLLTIAAAAQNYNAREDRTSDITVGFCIQAFNYPESSMRDIQSKADISFQTNTSLAMGAKYLQYFCYASLTGITGMQNNADIYGYVKEVNQELRKWDSVILDCEWQKAKIVMGSNTTTASANYKALADVQTAGLEDTALTKVTGVTGTEGTLIGEFKAATGRYGYMTVNFTEPSEEKSDIVAYTFDLSVKEVILYRNGVCTKHVLDDSKKLELTVPAGEAVFVIACE